MPDGTVVRARSVQAFPVEQLWSKDAVDRVKGMPKAPTGTFHLYRLQQKVQMMKDIGYLEILLFGLDTWKSSGSLQTVASVYTFAQGMAANLLWVTLKHAGNESSLRSPKILI